LLQEHQHEYSRAPAVAFDHRDHDRREPQPFSLRLGLPRLRIESQWQVPPFFS
jgi:hypothetical protein